MFVSRSTGVAVVEHARGARHLAEPHGGARPERVRQPDRLVQRKVHRLRLAVVDGDVVRVEVRAIQRVDDGVQPPLYARRRPVRLAMISEPPSATGSMRTSSDPSGRWSCVTCAANPFAAHSTVIGSLA